MSDPPQKLLRPDVRVEATASALILRAGQPLGAYVPHVGHWIRDWAKKTPDAPMLADRPGPENDPGPQPGPWRTVTYGAARTQIDRLSQALLDRGLGPERPLAILSEKSVRHGLLLFAAMQVGIPAVSLSASWSLRPEAHGRLADGVALLTPGLIYAEDPDAHAAALAVATRAAPHALLQPDWDDLAATAATPAVEAAFDAVRPETPARIMFTSGSTGPAKAAVVTHGNLTSNQQALRQVFPLLSARPPVVVDWQPWHHCGGGAYNLGAAIANGGAYYCDLGKPLPEQIGLTLRNLAGLHPTVHFNVPIGYDLLADVLEQDGDAARDFFRDLELIVYSAAGMPQSLWDRLARLAKSASGREIPMVSAYGMTEMAPMHTTVHWPGGAPGHIGAPVPGCEVRLLPAPDNDAADPLGRRAGRFELRARGPNITPGYFRQPDLTAAAFDEDGWYRSEDAVQFVDPADPDRGLRFDGRLVEQFKLQSGTWVMVGDLRTAVMSHLRPAALDVLVVGENEKEVGLLVFPDIDGCRRLTGRALDLDGCAVDAEVQAALADGIRAHNAGTTASSRRIGRILILADQPSFAAGETTDKGYINQRLAVSRRQAAVARLYADSPDPAGPGDPELVTEL